jgi:hypothetical protein|nr:MAG TPA: 26 kDa periplasmic immunogenic protein [Caudoviricetes sp.]
MDNNVYTARLECSCTVEDFKKFQELVQEMIEGNSFQGVDLSPYYPQETKKRILVVEMQKAREHLQKLCDNAYGKGTRVIMVSAQKSI